MRVLGLEVKDKMGDPESTTGQGFPSFLKGSIIEEKGGEK